MTTNIIYLYGPQGCGKDLLTSFFVADQDYTRINLMAYNWNESHRLALDIIASESNIIIIDEVVDDLDRLDPLFEIMTSPTCGYFKFILHSHQMLPAR
jgi:predicted AAA+ superfamily ATPase